MIDAAFGKRLTLFMFILIGAAWAAYVLSIAFGVLKPYQATFFGDLRSGVSSTLPWLYQAAYWLLFASPGFILVIISWAMLAKMDE